MEVAIKSSRKSTRRSRNGCRTCRARHIKCDEAPGACNNCTSTKRHCDGYDIGRLQGKKKRKPSVAALQDVGMHLGWVATSDEQRCFSFFMHCSVPDLTDFFNAPLWQKQALQMSLGDRAVYHAANMLGALHEDSNDNNMRLSGENLRRSQHRVALEQASRSFAHLHRRKASQDPQFQEVVLLCCLLFIMGDMVLGRYDSAFNHLRSGLRVLKEAEQKQNINKCLLATYARLEALAPHFGKRESLLSPPAELELPELDLSTPFKTPADVHRYVCACSNLAVPFLAKCWSLSPAQRAADYFELARQRDILIANFRRVELMLEDFYREFEPTATYQERKGIELLRLQIPGHYISLETCLIEGPAPESTLPLFTRHMAAHDRFMAMFPERPTISLGHGVIPALGVVVTRAPTYSIRLKALHALASWPHCEGFLNSNVVACVGIECLKAELLRNGQVEIPVLNENEREELTKFWSETMKSVPQLDTWSPVRSAQILQAESP